MSKFITLTKRGRHGEYLGRVIVPVDRIVNVQEEFDYIERREYSSVELGGYGLTVRESLNQIEKLLRKENRKNDHLRMRIRSAVF